jgi:hypothetical protein
MLISAPRVVMFLAFLVGVGIWGISVLVVISAFRRARRQIKNLEASQPMSEVPVPAFALHLVPPLLIGGMIAHAFQRGHGDDAGPLCAAACAFIIIQLVVGGMFGMGRRMFSVACTAIFIFVEMGIALLIYAATQG